MTFQPMTAKRQATQFMPVLLPAELAPHRAAVIGALAADGVGAGQYFSPHLGEQALFRDTALIEATPVADDVSARMLSLPITDAMRPGDAAIVAGRLRSAVAQVAGMSDVAQMRGDTARGCLIIGGGPAGTAVLTAASKKGLLERLAGEGLMLVERSPPFWARRAGRLCDPIRHDGGDLPVGGAGQSLSPTRRAGDASGGTDDAAHCGALGRRWPRPRRCWRRPLRGCGRS